ncbi:LD-carboxypeptidase [Sphingomonas sp. G-3-2-10]|jgi:muramoyltetrapeptide carboxypeptidase|uniref:LD-carboxypeptidase n=1 Tax=Sphingomonas sp. G-3-2-10 TaxID=2728838 RepID=UPI00146A65B2|nr:LD-carboxypeptidase [Sphingomonas sp. G-3-2-10]NML07417.1 LD-carboxypeptidase [Sphingomonas sp. G-3-2-10]
MRIGVVAPARTVTREAAARMSAFMALTYPGHEIVFHPQCFLEEGHFAGPDNVRAAAFLEFANDPAFDAIWFARGGYGSNRILHTIMPQIGLAARNKTYIGYSDMGFMLGALYARRIGRQAHGSMSSSMGRNDTGEDAGWVLDWLIDGGRKGLEPSLLTDRRPAAAFNLSILAALIGTPWLPDLTDHVLMIEEVDEPLYRIDRMLFQMAHATQLKGVAGIRLGQVTAIKDNGEAEGNYNFGETLEQMITRWCGEMGVPYLGRAEIGHVRLNRVVPFGVA